MSALDRARALRQQGRHEEALAAFAEAVKVAQAAGDSLLAAQVRIGEVDSLGMLGRYDEAIALAHALTPQLPPRDAARVLGNLGSLHLRLDAYELALACYDQARALLHDANEPLLNAGLSVNAGIALTYLGREAQAEACYLLAREYYQSSGSAFDVAVVETNLGFLQTTAGSHATALAYLLQAIQTFSTLGREHELARAAIDAGEICRALNLFPEALEHYEQAQAIFARLPLDYDRARAALGQAAIFAQQGRVAESETALEQADTLFEAQGNAVQKAQVQLLRALLRQRQGRAAEARAAALLAKQGFATAGLSGWAAEAQLVLGEELESVAALARATGRVWLESRAERALAQTVRERPLALEHLRRSLAALESLRARIAPEELHVSFLSDKEGVYGELAGLLLEGTPSEAEIGEALLVTERSRSRLLLERILAALEHFPESTLPTEALIRLRAELSRAYRETLPDSPGEPQRHGLLRGDLSQLERAYAQALRQSELSQLLPDMTLQGALPDVAALQQALSPDETLLVYTRLGERLAAFVVEKERLTAFPSLASPTELQHAARRFRYHLQKMVGSADLRAHLVPALEEELNAVLTHLYELVFRPLADTLRTERLVVVPAGVLHGLPLAALRNEKGSLLEQYELIVAPSASVWYTLTQRRRAVPRAGPALVVGISGAGTEQVSAEVAAVMPCLNEVTVLEGEHATLSAVSASMAGKAVLHFATHALFRVDNPLFSGLQLTEGWLLARDLYGLRLEADLVTLSACQTAVAEIAPGEEPFGLVRGFLAAGARQVAASLWPADDIATATLMEHFYRGLAEGKPAAAALRMAQRELQKRWPHPYYWAAFCLMGSH